MSSEILKINLGEALTDYIKRVCLAKVHGLVNVTWNELASIIYDETSYDRSGDHYRKAVKKWLTDIQDDVDSEEVKTQVQDLIREFKKVKVQLSDERAQNQLYIRRLSREETIKSIAHDAAKVISKQKPLSTTYVSRTKNDEAELIAAVSDWHYGMEIHNHWNTFDTGICEARVAKYLSKVLETCNMFNIEKVHLVNLSDLIAGRIHATIRLESREDVVTQTIKVAEILCDFIQSLISNGLTVEYYDCLDNHSRLEPIKSDSLELESLVRIIPWYIKERFSGCEELTVHTNEYSDDIIAFDVLGGKYRVGGVHGHKDKPGKVIENLTLMTKEKFDLILTAHLHHFSADESRRVCVVSNGSLMGTDTFAKDLRLDSCPSQNIIVCTNESVIDYIRRIPLD